MAAQATTPQQQCPSIPQRNGYYKRAFEVVNPLGGGAQGYVFKVLCKADRKEYAVKRIFLNSESDETDYAQREIDISTILNNRRDDPGYDYLVKYYAAWKEDVSHETVLYIQMELCDGETLEKWLNKPQDDDIKKEMFRQIVTAVHLMHTAGIMHRDLKPLNIFLTSSGSLKVGDYGLAKCIPAGTDMSAKGSHSVDIGTKNYMAPEVKNEPYTYRCDIYALGKIVVEMSTGHKRRGTASKNICEGSFLHKMLDKNPAERPKTEQILRHLDRSMAGITEEFAQASLSPAAPTRKHNDFVREPMDDKDVCEVPGIGFVHAKKLRRNGFPMAWDLYQKWCDSSLEALLTGPIGMKQKNAEKVINDFREWHAQFGQ